MADRYWVSGGDGNWGSTNNWSTSSGGAGGSSVPTSADNAFFDGNSPACVVNSSNRVCAALNFTGYTATITFTFNVTASGSVTLSASMTIAGAGALNVNTVATLTSNGKTWTAGLGLIANGTITLADDWIVTGTLTLSVSSANTVVNGFSVEAQAGVTYQQNFSLSGSTVIKLTGTGTFAVPSLGLGGLFGCPLTINTAGTITFSGTGFRYGGSGNPTFACTAGTVNAAGTTLDIGGPCTLSVSGITWGAIRIAASSGNTITLSQNLACSGLLTLGTGNFTTTVNGFAIRAGGGLRNTGSTGVLAGTTEIVLTGTGTVDGPSITSGRLATPVTIDAGAGTITFAATVNLDASKLSYISGTVVAGNAWPTGGGASPIYAIMD